MTEVPIEPDPSGDANAQPPSPINPVRPQTAGYGDAMLLAGRTRGRVVVYIGALLLAAAADIGNFYQIVAFAMPEQYPLLLGMIVAGLTGCVLFLAHSAGVLLRDQKADDPAVRPTLMWACLVVWALIGLFGLYLRFHYHPVIAGAAPKVVGQAPAAPVTGTSTGAFPVVGSAMLFFGLYLGTGVVAVVGGYLTHNPVAAAFRRARDVYDKEAERTADAARDYAMAEGQLLLLESLVRNGRVIQKADDAELVWVGEELKQRARTRIAQRVQDAALTDAYFPDDDDEPTATDRTTTPR